MHLTSVELVNVGPHDRLEVAVPVGVVGVVGPNGSGKSTLLGAVYWALTGRLPPGRRSKSDLIRTQAPPQAPACVRLTGVHDGQPFVLRRSLRGGRPAELHWAGGVVTDARSVADALRELGADPDVLEAAVFHWQDSLYSVLDASPAVRTRAVAAVAGLTACETAYEILGDALASLRVDPAACAAHTQAAEQVGRLAARLQRLRTRLDRLERRLLPPERRERLERRLRVLRRWSRRLDQLPYWQRRLRVLDERVRAVTAALADAERWQEVWPFHEAANRARRRLEQARAQLPPEPQHPRPDPNQLETWRRDLARAEAALEAAHRTLATLTDGGLKPVCPVCGQTVTESLPALVQSRRRVRRLPGQIEAVRQALAAAEQAQREWEVYDAAVAHLDRLEAEAAAAAAAVPGPLPSKPADDLSRLRSRQASLAARRSRLEAVIARVRRWADRLCPGRIHRLSDRLERDDRLRRRQVRLTGRIAELERAHAEAVAQRDRWAEAAAAARRASEWADVLTRARTIVHRDGLPRELARRHRDLLTDAVNARLEPFGVPFRVTVGDVWEVTVHWPDRPSHPASWLSGGQKTLLATAFWSGLASLGTGCCDMLVLDEPTAGLDADHLRGLTDALAALAASSRGRFQVFVVTHAEPLRSVCDAVIDLGGRDGHDAAGDATAELSSRPSSRRD